MTQFFKSTLFLFLVWFSLSLGVLLVFLYGISTSTGAAAESLLGQTKTMFTPGEMTHGHYQIELACNACHTPMMGVKQDACLNCHEEELKIANDTHPASKFADPTNIERLELLDATKCITCHREHVPERTHPMGLSLPEDYCYHCHQETLEQRPSHANFAFDSCSNAGCHNYHDNRALYENFLMKHADEPDFLAKTVVPQLPEKENFGSALTRGLHDAPDDITVSAELLSDWAETAHAAAGVNCKQCHETDETANQSSDAVSESAKRVWSDKVSPQTCGKCHENELKGFSAGRHGMRIPHGLSPMTPGQARLPMKAHALHAELNCSSCHSGHRFDTKLAAVDACVKCHNDMHTLAYLESSHYSLWLDEQAGDLPAGSGVSCATCHMPRMEVDYEMVVQHNQNDNLRPNEKMIRTVCMNCHGAGFSIDSLADSKLVEQNFQSQTKTHVESIDMVKAWFDAKAKKKKAK